MFTRHLLLVLALTIFSANIFAQSGKVKKAKEQMDALNFLGAIQMLQQMLEKDDNSEAKILLADCYRSINDTENAEYWFGQVVRLPEAQPIHKLQYGRMLQINGKCDLAKEWYEQFTREVPDDVRGQYLVKACDYEDELMTKNAGIYEIGNVPFNSNLDDYTPSITKNGVIFASDRDKGSAVKRQHMWTGNPFAELYMVEAKKKGEDENISFDYGRPDKYTKSINTKYHEAAVSFSPDGKTIFFTRNNYLNGKAGKSDEGIIKLKIYYGAAKGDDNWSNLESLPFNSDEYSVAHPALSQDGQKLYFSSDMPGGFGGMDLYVSEQENGRWGPPTNLGPNSNTEGNEIFPFMDQTGRLYFASDGHVGLGGLDNFYTTEKGAGEWNLPINLGYPINTTHDDFSIVFNENGTNGYFASDRDGGVGRDDIYSFKKIATPVQLFVFDELTKEPIAGASVLSSLSGVSLITGTDGKATLDMKLNECADFKATKEMYREAMKQGCTKGVKLGETVVVEIPMKKDLKFDVEGIVFDMGTGLPLTGAKVTLMNDCGKPAPTALMTDATGRYKFPLDAECCYQIKAEKEGYIAQMLENKCTKGLKDSKTMNENLNLQPYIAGATTGNDKPKTDQPAAAPLFSATQLPKGMKIDEKTGLIVGKKGKPVNADLGGGWTVKDGIPYKDGVIASIGTPDKTTGTGVASNSNNNSNNPKKDESGTVHEPGPGTPAPGEPIGFLVHIYYDFDQAYIRSESNPALKDLLKMMKVNEEFVVEIGSHTDARGSDSYNSRLAQRRADAVVRWLVKNGIQRSRLVPNGYGETVNVNNCKNNIPCSEQEHQMNRRTEFRIVGKTDQKEYKVSTQNADTKVDPCQGCPF
jgi:outer membrane protein OmpA-like peptidoglycan-associated protein/tetratricopeptide (TPR) repeat protein